MKHLLLYLILFLLFSCKAQTLSIEYDTEKPSVAQINYTKNEDDSTKHYIVFRDSFGSEAVKLYDDDKLIDEGDLALMEPSFGYPHTSIIDRKTRKVKIVFDNDVYFLNLDKEYQYVFIDKVDGKINVLFSKYVKFHF